jgi:hypothetical protein
VFIFFSHRFYQENFNAENQKHRVLVKALNKSFKKSHQLIDVVKAIQNTLSEGEKAIKHFELVDNEQLIVTLTNKKGYFWSIYFLKINLFSKLFLKQTWTRYYRKVLTLKQLATYCK